jgi:hypothetical protein
MQSKTNPLLNRRFHVLPYTRRGRAVAALPDTSESIHLLLDAFHADPDPGIRKQVVLTLTKRLKVETPPQLAAALIKINPQLALSQQQIEDALRWHLSS